MSYGGLGRCEDPSRLAPRALAGTSEFGAMAVFLASDHARNLTGQTLNIDGGLGMHS